MLSPPRNALRTFPATNLVDTELAELGSSILRGRTGELYAGCSSVWDRLLPQLRHQECAVHAALAAFGATYKATFLTSGVTESLLAAGSCSLYGRALRTLSAEIMSHPRNQLGPLIACVILAFTEIIQRREMNALAHFVGALAYFDQGRKRQGTGGDYSIYSSSSGWEHELINFLLRLDVQIASYTMGRPLFSILPPSHGTSAPVSSTIHNTASRALSTIHTCYDFNARVTGLKYVSASRIPLEILAEQDTLVAQLCSSLEDMHLNVDKLQPGICTALETPSILPMTSVKTYVEAQILLMHVLSTFIYTSTILDATETAYDQYEHQFEEIVSAASEALRVENRMLAAGIVAAPLRHFRGELGVLQPLFLTGLKCRDPNTRGRAVALMRGVDQEGPFDGRILAVVAARVLEIEHEGRNNNHDVRCCADIDEPNRVYGAAMNAERHQNESVFNAPKLRSVQVGFSRCRDIRLLVAEHSDKVGMDSGVAGHGVVWELWDEVLFI